MHRINLWAENHYIFFDVHTDQEKIYGLHIIGTEFVLDYTFYSQMNDSLIVRSSTL